MGGSKTKKSAPAASKNKNQKAPSSKASTGGSGTQKTKKIDKRAVKPSATLPLPVARIKKIMKHADDIGGISGDAIHTVGKAAELFVNHLAKAALSNAESEGRRGVTYNDLCMSIQVQATIVSATDNLHFLQDVIPGKVTVEAALRMIDEAKRESASAEQ